MCAQGHHADPVPPTPLEAGAGLVPSRRSPKVIEMTPGRLPPLAKASLETPGALWNVKTVEIVGKLAMEMLEAE